MANHWYWYVISFGLVGGYGCWYLRNYRRRTAALAADAATRGWHYTERPPSLLGRCHGVPFGTGRRPRAWHEVSGTYRDLPFSAFEFSEVIGDSDAESSDRPERRFLQVFGVRLAQRVPDLTVMPRGSAAQLALKLGMSTGATGNPDFDRHWAVSCDDPAFIATVLTPDLLSWFLGAPERQRPFRLRSDEICCWQEGRLTFDDVEPALTHLHEVLARTRLGRA
jgi:hypothetical protein